MEMSFGQIIKEAFSTSDSCGKFIVVALAVCSAIAWCILIQKGLQVYTVRQLCRRFRQAFQDCASSPLEMMQRFGTKDDYLTGPLKELLFIGIQTLLEILGIDERDQRNFFRHGCLPRRLTSDEIEKIRTMMNRSASSQGFGLEDNMTMLGVLVTVSPLLGLFGTVWGVMVTFIGIAQEGRPDIATIAPGISGALLTTVGGLVVAIPALIANNLITHAIEQTFTDMDVFIDDFISNLRLEDVSASENSAQRQMPNTGTGVRPSAQPSRSQASAPSAATASYQSPAARTYSAPSAATAPQPAAPAAPRQVVNLFNEDED